MPITMWVRWAAVISCVALLLTGCGESSPPGKAPTPPPVVTVVKALDEEVRPSFRFTGRIEAVSRVDLRARVDGFLQKRLFVEGADVKEGELLFVVEKGLYEAAVSEARAGLEK